MKIGWIIVDVLVLLAIVKRIRESRKHKESLFELEFIALCIMLVGGIVLAI